MGRPTFVLVPGAGGDPGYWHLVVEALTERGFDSVAVDLPGPDPEVGLTGYVEIVVEAVRSVDSDVVLVGQSMGGLSAAWAAGIETVEELVLLNAMIAVPGETGGGWWTATAQGEAVRANDVADGRDPDGGFDADVYFFHDVPLDAMVGLGEERDEAEISFAEPFGLEEWPDVPTRVLVGVDDRLFPAGFQEKVAWDRLHQDVERIPGGHLAALSRPVDLVEALVRPHL